jgi:lipoprotein signal peptidase
LSEDEKEKDRVIARAIVDFLKKYWFEWLDIIFNCF